jgi:hypothetical protein
MFPPPPYAPLCSFPFADHGSGSGGVPAGLARPAPFRYPLTEKDLAVVKERMRESRRDRARASRMSSGAGAVGEPSVRAVDRAATALLASFERDRAELFGLHVRAQVEQGAQRALAPVLARLAGANRGSQGEGEGEAGAAGGSALSTPEQLALLKLSYALLRVGGRAGPQTRFGQSRRALPTFLAAATAPPYLQQHHLWSAAEEAEEARRMEQDEQLEDEPAEAPGHQY